MAEHNKFGKTGEEKAVAYLLKEGYLVLERNWRLGHLELDIICLKDGLLVVVEVKTRHIPGERPGDLLNFQKRRNIRRAANAYVKAKGIDKEVRFDLILVTGKKMEVVHIKDALQVFE